MTRALLAPLELLYAAALRVRNARYQRIPAQQLQWPVISVGNLSAGGSGKTPLVIHLAQLLEQRGWSADVLSRGYGRRSDAVERVDPEGDARRFGDEPLMIAQATRGPVFVGASRYAAGELAEREGARGPKPVHLLDDGFQHRQLARSVDIVVIHPSDLSDRLLPSGRLREPLTALARAGVIVLRTGDDELAHQIKPYAPAGAWFWRVKRELSLSDTPGRAIAFCAIARPAEFYQALAKAGTDVIAARSFRDHHSYTAQDMAELSKLGARQGCEEFVTTEKDAVKLDAGLRRQLTRVAPLRVARLSLEIEQESAAIAQLLAMLETPGAARAV